MSGTVTTIVNTPAAPASPPAAPASPAEQPPPPPADAHAMAVPLQAPPATPTPDAVVIREGNSFDCSIDEAALLQIRQRAAKLVRRAGERAYAEFPIDRQDLSRKTIGIMLTEKNICQALAPFAVAEKDHNALREKYKSDRLSVAEGAPRGLVGRRLPLTAKCPEGYDWENSPVYAGADSCEDVTEEFEGKGIPTVLYSTEFPAAAVVAYLSAPTTASFYTRYANDGPVACSDADAFFHVIRVWGPFNAAFAMRTFQEKSWSAWTLANSCTTADGEAHHPTDIMFDFGIRVFVPIEVEIDGERVARTLVIAQVAAASEGLLAKLIDPQIPFERLISCEYAKKLLLEAKARGWKVEKTK